MSEQNRGPGPSRREVAHKTEPVAQQPVVQQPEVETPPQAEIIPPVSTRKNVEECRSAYTASDYEEFKTPLPMHTITQASSEVERSWRNFAKVDYERKVEAIGLFATPELYGERMWAREGAQWSQSLAGPTKEFGVRPISGKALSSAHSILSTLTGSGTCVSVFMPASGFYVSFRAPDEANLCDYDFTWGLESSIIGVSSTGMMLNASSGIYLAHQFNFALNYVEDTTIVHNASNIRTVMLNRLNEQDYGLFILGPLIAKFMGGFPFTLECSVGTCNHQRDARINLGRIINYDRSALTKRQMEISEECNSSSSMTDKLYDEYQQEHKKLKESRVLIAETSEGDKVYLEVSHCNIGRYLDKSTEWIKDVEDTNNVIMASMATEVQRRKHLQTRAETRRILRYIHLISAIITVSSEGEENEITDEAEIRRYLVGFSSKPSLVRRIEQKIGDYVVASQLSLIGYMAYACESCGKKPEPGEEFVPISPDTLFFTLAQQVSSLYQVLANPEELLV